KKAYINFRLTSVGKTGLNAVTSVGSKVSSLANQPRGGGTGAGGGPKEEKTVPPLSASQEKKPTKEEKSTHDDESMLNEALSMDFSDLMSLKLVYKAGPVDDSFIVQNNANLNAHRATGEDNLGRPVVVFVPANWVLENTERKPIDLRRMLLFFISVLDKVV